MIIIWIFLTNFHGIIVVLKWKKQKFLHLLDCYHTIVSGIMLLFFWNGESIFAAPIS